MTNTVYNNELDSSKKMAAEGKIPEKHFYYDLLSQIDDLEGDLWGEYSYALDNRGDWERSDAASLLIAWLVATDRCTMDDLKAGLKVFQKIGNCAVSAHNRGIDFGPDDFVEAVMYEARKEMGEKQS